LLTLKGEALIKGHFLSLKLGIKDGASYRNFFTAISDQIDPLLVYFINDEVSASLIDRGPVRSLIEEATAENYRAEHFKMLEYAKGDLSDLFTNRTNFIISSSFLEFKVSTYSAFEQYTGELYDQLVSKNPRSNKKTSDLIGLIEKYSANNDASEKALILEKIKKLSFYVSSSEKIEYVLSKVHLEKDSAIEARKFLKFYRSQRNTIHNLGTHIGESQSEIVNGIEIILENGKPSFTENHNSAIFACRKLMTIYESMHEGITGDTIF
jgi:hypothetical protein